MILFRILIANKYIEGDPPVSTTATYFDNSPDGNARNGPAKSLLCGTRCKVHLPCLVVLALRSALDGGKQLGRRELVKCGSAEQDPLLGVFMSSWKDLADNRLMDKRSGIRQLGALSIRI